MAAAEIEFQWVHLQHQETSAFTETYGFAGTQGMVNLEGILLRPKGRASRTLFIYMHPSSTLQLLPVPRAAAAQGAHVLCAASRYARNDAPLIMEKVLLDLGAYVRHAREVWGYEKVVLVGWSGGGSLAVFYQSQAENPTITHTPAGDPLDIVGARLLPVDAVVYQAAHLSRARLLLDWLDPSVSDENAPDQRDVALDIYDPRNTNQPPYSPEFIATFRAGQLARMRRITQGVKDTLRQLKDRKSPEVERGFVVHRTLAEPRFRDATLDPNDRKPGWCYLGNPETVNTGPVGLARFCTLRSWLSQWSVEDTRADALDCAPKLRAPLLVIENTADDAVPQPHPRMVFEAAGSADKSFLAVQGATHYYAGQPQLVAQVNVAVRTWLAERALIEAA